MATARAAASAADDGGTAAPAAWTGCLPFASVRTPANRIESLALLPASVNGEGGALRRAMVVSRGEAAAAPAAEWLELAPTPPGYREVWLPAASLLAGDAAERGERAERVDKPEQGSDHGERNEGADAVPQRWQRDVTLLVRQMKKQALAPDTVWVRLVLQGEGEAARVSAVELVDEGTGSAIDSALWLDRDDGPGGFVSARGGDHERLLWQSPVDYRRISRGVGAASVIVRRRVLAKPKTPDGKPRMVVRSFRTHGQHQGVDFAAPKGTPVVVVADGTVVHAGRSGGYGNLVVVDHGGGITTYYAHLSAFGVQEGMRVERGQEIGQVGSTGMSTGPHLHYEIRKDGKYLDPADPAQSLPNWSLGAGEHRAALARLLALSLSREQAFARATRAPALASAAVVSAAASAPQGGEAE
ncbi:MAG: M23 family metallopeptidase [Rubrivivax sp.]|nr:M23 family metallopeptidase [Rubrivivax sp.]